MTHTECVQAASSWLHSKCDVVLPEFFCWNSELADAIGFRVGGKSILIECKVSRGDFLSDKKKPFRFSPERGMGDLRYYCCPSGLIKPEEVPAGWGLIYIFPSRHVKQVKAATTQPKNVEADTHQVVRSGTRLAVRTMVKIPTVEGLALALNISRDTVYAWAADKDKPEFSDTYERLQVVQGDRLISLCVTASAGPLDESDILLP